jgi:hypothetical protein
MSAQHNEGVLKLKEQPCCRKPTAKAHSRPSDPQSPKSYLCSSGTHQLISRSVLQCCVASRSHENRPDDLVTRMSAMEVRR